MRETTRGVCPHCWQTIDFDLPGYDTRPVESTIDCEVCCRPIRVVVTWEEDGKDDPMVSVEAES